MSKETLIEVLDGDDLVGIDLLGLDLVKIEDRNEDQCRKTCIESAVVEDKSTVHCRSGGADDRTDKACDHTVFEAIASCNGAEARCEGKTVDVCLRCKRPRNIKLCDGADRADKREEYRISKHDGRHVFGILTVCREGECREYDSCGCTGKSGGRGERGDQGGQKADQIKIDQNAKSVNAKIDQTEGYAEFICKIQAVARAGKQLFVIAEAFSVKQEA